MLGGAACMTEEDIKGPGKALFIGKPPRVTSCAAAGQKYHLLYEGQVCK